MFRNKYQLNLLRLVPLFLAFLLFSCTTNQQEQDSAQKRPNVILILTDDQGYGDLKIHGNPWVNTPVLDSLAVSGTRLDRFFVSPVCAPTRASLLTGRYHPRTGVMGVSRGLENMRAEEFTLAELFKSASYTTGCFGKWHNGAHWPYHPNAQGFDEFVGFCAGHWNNYFDTTLEHNGEPYPTKGYITDVLTDEALAFIENSKEEPFFCYIPYNVPHSPFQVPDRYFDKYYEKLAGIEDEKTRAKNACVYGMVENVDDNIRRITQKIDDLGLSENTIVIFLSDNGPNGHRYNDDMRGGKGSVHEGGVRVPFFIRWPGKIPAGKTLENISSHIDLLPTLAGLCEIEVPEDVELDGVSLESLITGKTDRLPERALFSHWAGKGGVRTSRYRLAPEGNSFGLFDLTEDPSEVQNLAQELPGKYDSLKQKYDRWYENTVANYETNTRIPVGYAEFPRVVMPAHESDFSGKVNFKEGHGWANDWLVNWSSSSDSIWWDIEVVNPGNYLLSLQYTCPVADVGSVLAATAGNEKVSGKVREAFNPEYTYSPDRVIRKEVYEKEWATLTLGEIQLREGKQQLVLKADKVPGAQVAELKSAILERIE